jgi:predicted small integral membrane protein
MLSVWLFMILAIPPAVLSLLLGTLIESFGLPLLESLRWTGLLLGASLGCLLWAAGMIYLIARWFGRWQPSSSLHGQQEKSTG